MSTPANSKVAGRSVSAWRVRLTDEMGAAVPVLLPELRAICVDYTARQFVDWDAEHIGIAAGEEGEAAHVAFSPASEPPQTVGRPLPRSDPSVSAALVSRDVGVSVTHEVGRFAFVFGKSTIRESGLTRWAVRIVENPPAIWQGIGVTPRNPPAAVSADGKAAPNRSDFNPTTDSEAVLYDTYTGAFATRKGQTVSAYDSAAPARAVAPHLHKWQTGALLSDGVGLVLTFDADLQANTLSVQLHWAGDVQKGIPAKPSQVLRVTLPPDRPLADMRPVMALWGPAVTFCDVDPGDVFPRLTH